MAKVTKKRAGIGGGAVLVAVAALQILGSNPQDARLPDDAIVAIYPDRTFDAFYAVEFAEARDTAQVRSELAQFYAIPKDALIRVSRQDEMVQRAHAEGDARLAAFLPAIVHAQDSIWTIFWTTSQVRADGELLDPKQDYPKRFTLKEIDP